MRRERKSSRAADPAAHMFLSPAGPAQCPKRTPAPFPLRLPLSRHRALAPSPRELTDVEASHARAPIKPAPRPLGFPFYPSPPSTAAAGESPTIAIASLVLSEFARASSSPASLQPEPSASAVCVVFPDVVCVASDHHGAAGRQDGVACTLVFLLRSIFLTDSRTPPRSASHLASASHLRPSLRVPREPGEQPPFPAPPTSFTSSIRALECPLVRAEAL